MLAEFFHPQSVTSWGPQTALVTESQAVTWQQLSDLTCGYRDSYQTLHGCRVGLCLRGTGPCIGMLAALEMLACEVTLFDADLPEPIIRDMGVSLGLAAILRVSNEANATWQLERLATAANAKPAAGGGITILTSGTTGQPKPIRHSWRSLARPVRRSAHPRHPVWLLSFRPHLYAGLQVMLQCFALGGKLVAPSGGATPQTIIEMMVAHHVAFASATPSYWRRLVLFSDRSRLHSVPLQQITLGGEIADQRILDQLAEAFPAARISHIYATTELGRCFTVKDRRAGFPADYLNRELPDGVRLQIRSGELFVQSANAMEGYGNDLAARSEESWIATGDLVEHREDRVYFCGRLTDMINVGGNKVNPATVEEAIREMAEIADVRVYAVPSSVAGQLVACDVVATGPGEESATRARVAQACRERLASFQVPRVIRVVSEIDLSPSGKKLRRE